MYDPFKIYVHILGCKNLSSLFLKLKGKYKFKLLKKVRFLIDLSMSSKHKRYSNIIGKLSSDILPCSKNEEKCPNMLLQCDENCPTNEIPLMNTPFHQMCTFLKKGYFILFLLFII